MSEAKSDAEILINATLNILNTQKEILDLKKRIDEIETKLIVGSDVSNG